ncbi:cytochrome b5 reductase 4 [Globomyces pollinis-pini]|nr:cytochrome b5 reductase 4 [Globomyces pollinis-pini]
MDWAKLKSSNADLTQGRTKLARFTLEELSLHNKKDDMWMAYQGKVYNVTPYVNFHPGGTGQLLRGAGKDATDLIRKIHPWVNIDMMLDKCCIGYFTK